MQKVVGFFSKPENLFVLTLLIGLFTGTYKVVSKASNHNNSLYQRVSSPICFYLRLFGYVYTLPWIGSLLISGGNYEEWLQASKNTEPYRFFIIGLVMIFGSYAMYIPVLLERIARGIMNMMAQADARSTGSLPVPVHFVLEEARNITLPDSFQNWVATMRSRNITLSIILQNISQIKRMFPDDWESVSGMCDEILYLGGNEQSTHEWISKAMGQETIDNRSYGTTHSWTSGSNSTNEQNSGRALMDVTEVRLKNKLLKGKIGSVIMILADERPIIDEKYDLNRHPRIKLSADGGAPQYSYVSSALLPETNTIQINETDVDEDEVDGMFTFDLQNVELN